MNDAWATRRHVDSAEHGSLRPLAASAEYGSFNVWYPEHNKHVEEVRASRNF